MNGKIPDASERGIGLCGAIRRGCFPHQLSWLIDNPVRRLFIRPTQLADRLPLTSKSSLLEVGPGSGYFTVELARRVPEGRLELLDLQPEMLAKAVRKFGPSPPRNLAWTAADACDVLPYEEGTFDVIVLVTVLGELPDPRRALESFHRVLRAGGILAVHEHLPDPDFVGFRRLCGLTEREHFRLRRRWGHAWNYTALFESVGTQSS